MVKFTFSEPEENIAIIQLIVFPLGGEVYEEENNTIEVIIYQNIDSRYFDYDKQTRDLKFLEVDKVCGMKSDGTPDLYQWMGYDVIKDPDKLWLLSIFLEF